MTIDKRFLFPPLFLSVLSYSGGSEYRSLTPESPRGMTGMSAGMSAGRTSSTLQDPGRSAMQQHPNIPEETGIYVDMKGERQQQQQQQQP